jgi:hypothetical protein
VSPPWVAETHLQGRYGEHAGDCRRWAGVADVIAIAVTDEASVVFRVTGRWHCERVSANRGRLTSPLLCCTNARPLGICGFRCTCVT